MRILFLQNDMGSPGGVLHEVTLQAGHQASVLVPYKGLSHDPSLPGKVPTSPDGFDGLVVLGGAMSTLEEEAYPFIEATRSLMRSFDKAQVPVMGICFGAQLMASTHGGKVRPLGFTEWGFLPQTWAQSAAQDPLLADAPMGLHLMQWHGDTFDLPTHAIPLSNRSDCPAQAFRIGDTNWGFQFHLEMDEPTLLNWAVLRAEALKEAPGMYVEKMRQDISLFHAAHVSFARMVMQRWLALCVKRKAER